MAVISKISINYFRNLESQYITPSKEINLFVANNAQGKTNLIEAIYYLGHNRSFKTKTIKEVIHFDHQSFQLIAQIDSNRIKLEKSKNKNTITINQQRINNTSQLSQILPIQIITPDKGFIVNGTPKNKRSYLDWGVFHVKPSSVKAFKAYNKVLKNINTLLVKNKADELDFWFLALAKSAAEINQNRIDYLQQLKKTVFTDSSKLLTTLINPLDQFDYQFSSGWPKEVDDTNEQSIYNYLSNNSHHLLRVKHLNYGSHKASIQFSLNNKYECFLSRGEQKTLSIIFWLTQVLLLVNLKIKPVVLIDDLSSELDNKKINIILQYLKALKVQTFMTDIGHNLDIIERINPSIFQIDNGVITIKD
ncbi:MAG: DNA replication and repair protein RecF [Gammaproteobacteria bacterium]|nr:DNA replication and repair protein RecF [Gammaproteobacteria bacterium]